MSVAPMRPELQIVYKNLVDNLSAMKKQQWTLTSYVVAIFAGVAPIIHLYHPCLSESARVWLTSIPVIGVIASWYFLINIQRDIAGARCTAQKIAQKYFDAQEIETFRMRYETFRRDT
jgi:hypothetical protein